MSERDNTTQQDQPAEARDQAPGDDRRGSVNPADNPHPSSPEPEADAIREGEEKLDRV